MSSIDTRVKDLIREQLTSNMGEAPDQIADDASMDDFGINSVAQLAFLKKVNETFGVNIPVEAADTITTVGKLREYLEANAS